MGGGCDEISRMEISECLLALDGRSGPDEQRDELVHADGLGEVVVLSPSIKRWR